MKTFPPLSLPSIATPAPCPSCDICVIHTSPLFLFFSCHASLRNTSLLRRSIHTTRPEPKGLSNPFCITHRNHAKARKQHDTRSLQPNIRTLSATALFICAQRSHVGT